MDDSRNAARKNWDAYVRARDAGHDKYLDIAKRCEEFYLGGGKQWKEADRQRLESEGKPVLEINMVLSTVNAMLGERINQRSEIRFQPRQGGAAQIADAVLTPLARHIQDDNDYHFVEGEVFADGVVQDRGYFDIRMDFDKDERGEIRITSLDPLTVIPDPFAKNYDTRTWNEVLMTRWMTLDEVEDEYGKAHRKKVESFAMMGDDLGRYEVDCIEWATRDSHFGDPEDIAMADALQDRTVARVRVIERQYRMMGEARMFVDPDTGDKEEISEDISDARAAELAGKLGMAIKKEVRRRVRWTVSVGDHVLKDVWSPYSHFTVVGFFPYFRRGRPFGIVRNLLSPQEQLNKAESQELHIINTTANSGWDIEAGQLVNMTEQELEQRGAQTGLVVVRKPGSAPLVKIQPNSVPTGISNVGAKAASSIRTISGVYDAMLGDTGREISGVALESKLSRGLVQFQVPFDNLNRTRQILGELMYALMRDYYTEERIYHVADFNQPGYPITPVEINKQMFDGSVLNDITVGEYGVSIDIGPSRNNAQEAQFTEAIELRNAGVMVPDHVVIENSHLLHRHEIAEMVRNLQGFKEPSPEEAQMAQALAQFQMEKAGAELDLIKAKAMMLQAQAMQHQAKAGDLESGVQLQAAEMQANLELELRKLDQRWAEMQAILQNKLQLADVHSTAKTSLTQYTTRAKQTTEEMRMRNERDMTGLKAVTQLAAAKQSAAARPAPKPTTTTKPKPRGKK